MGNFGSKKLASRLKKKQKAAAGQENSQYANPDNEDQDDIELRLLRRAIRRDPESFVLNNLMMCVQFFGNYEEEIEHVKSALVSSREAELNARLPPQKHVLLPDVLQEQVARNVGFTSNRQTFRPTVEPLQPVRIYVVHDNMDVAEQNYSTHYSSVNDAVTYNMLLKPSEHQGYVQLQLLEDISALKNSIMEDEVDLSSIAEDDDEIYSDGDSVYGTKRNSKMLSRHPKMRHLRNSSSHTRSLPDLHDDQILYEENGSLSSRDVIYETRSSHDVKLESDYEHEERRYRAQRAWCKREIAARRGAYPRSKPNLRSKNHWTNSRSPASSTSSGYRSGSYVVDSDSDCSCTTIHNYNRARNCSVLPPCNRHHNYESTHSCSGHPGSQLGRSCSSAHSCSCSRKYHGTLCCNAAHPCETVTGCNATQNINSSRVYNSSRNISQSCESIPNCGTPQRCQSPPNPAKDVPTETYSTPLNSALPRRCFKKVTYTSEGKIYNAREERKQLLNSKQRRIRLALRRHNYDVLYISSIDFMRHFINLFVDQYADALGFDRDAVDDVKPDGCVIYCDKVMVSHTSRHSRVEPYEVIPTVWLEWPECAQEWLDRPRSTWPDYDDIKKIKEFGCYIVPEGFQPKNGNNPSQDLEWQLSFPAAERYLETCLTRTQVQVYLIALMLHKTFIRPVFDTLYGLTTSHIRNKLFWMIEENDRPSKWPENRSGECLLQLLNSLYHCISQNEPTLPDYFVRDRNLFQRIPFDHLLHTQKQLKRIIENPVMYVFHAMENVRHSQKFFPRLDYEMLLKILTVDALALVNPALGRHIFRSISPTNDNDIMQEEDEERTYRPGGFWDRAKIKKDQSKIYSSVPITNKTLISPRKATDSIIEISIRCAELEGPRLCALLDFFVRHFIKMAERCHQYRAYQQKIIYLDHSDRLSILLSEHPRYRDDAKAYRDKIKALRKRCGTFRSQTDLPETPKRNPETAIFVAPLKDRFARESFTDRSQTSESATYEQTEHEYDRGDPDYGFTTAVVHKGSTDSRLASVDSSSTSKNTEIDKRTMSISSDETRPSSKSEESLNLKRPVSPQVPKVSNEKEETLCDRPSPPALLRVLSLVENQNESFLTETTYI